MRGLERISPARWVRPVCCGRMHHHHGQILTRHIHEIGFATIVLSGTYVEAGDTGRHRAEPGDVLLHQPYEAHLDRFDLKASDVLVIPITRASFPCVIGRLRDVDTVVRAAESSSDAAETAVFEQLEPRPVRAPDWPDQLAHALQENPSLSLRRWAQMRGLSLGSVSRGFVQVYGVTPASYRLLQRTHHAIRAIRTTDLSLTEIAQDCGFADQAHMTRSVQRSTALSPRALRLRWPSGPP